MMLFTPGIHLFLLIGIFLLAIGFSGFFVPDGILAGIIFLVLGIAFLVGCWQLIQRIRKP